MNYRAPLLDQDGKLSNDHYHMLTVAQLAKFAQWSIETGKPVLELMHQWVIEYDAFEPVRQGTGGCFLTGKLPCGLYGGMRHDGSTHT